MVKKISEISVFFPTFNEEKNIKRVVNNTKKVLLEITDKWEIIIVNDGSKDKTAEVAAKLSQKDKRIRVKTHKVNRGYGGALKTGFKSAKYAWVAFIDSDGQFDFTEIKKFLKHTETADLILGYRMERADPFIRRFYTFIWTKMLPKIIFRLKVRDYSCGFKLIKKEVFDEVQPLVGEEKVTQIEMLVKAQRMEYKFAEVGVHHYPREFGKQTGANLNVVVKSITDLVKLWKKLR